MKVLLDDATAAPDLSERFLREIKVVAALEHPNIASLRTAFKVDDQLIMIMELVEGSSLDEKLRGGRLHPLYALECTCQVLAALSYAHRLGVIHRDHQAGEHSDYDRRCGEAHGFWHCEQGGGSQAHRAWNGAGVSLLHVA